MSRYHSGEEPRPGDVVRRIADWMPFFAEGVEYEVAEAGNSDRCLGIKGISVGRLFAPKYFDLIRRATLPALDGSGVFHNSPHDELATLRERLAAVTLERDGARKEIDRIMQKILDHAYRQPEPERVQMAHKIRELTAQLAAAERDRDQNAKLAEGLHSQLADARRDSENRRREVNALRVELGEVTRERDEANKELEAYLGTLTAERTAHDEACGKLESLRDALKYAGWLNQYPFRRLPQLIETHRQACRNQDDRDFWGFVISKIDAALAGEGEGEERLEALNNFLNVQPLSFGWSLSKPRHLSIEYATRDDADKAYALFCKIANLLDSLEVKPEPDEPMSDAESREEIRRLNARLQAFGDELNTVRHWLQRQGDLAWERRIAGLLKVEPFEEHEAADLPPEPEATDHHESEVGG